MRERAPLLLLLASASAFLAGLYLPWLRVAGPAGSSSDGWSEGMPALFALALAASASAALARPGLAPRVPVGRCALGTAYFGLAAYLQVRRALGAYPPTGTHLQTAYGAYLALGAVVAALLAAGAMRSRGLSRRPSASEAATALLAAGGLAALLLPWLRGERTTLSGIDTVAAATLAAAALWLGAHFWRRRAHAGERLAWAAGVAVLVAATLDAIGSSGTLRYGAWLGLGCAVGLVGIAALTAAHLRPALPPPRMAATAATSIVLLVSLFLPWQEYHIPQGTSLTANGWFDSWGSAAGAVVIALVAVSVLRGVDRYLPELVAAVAVFLTTVGFLDASLSDYFGFGYGAYIGFAAAALLVLVQFPPPSPDRKRMLRRLSAVAACLGYLVIAVVPQWNLLSSRLNRETPDRTFWLTVTGIALALHLLATWLRQPGSGERVVWIPLGLLALVALDLVHERSSGIGWGGIAVVALCLLLALLGWIERGGDARRIPLPEFLRIDRLPEAQG